MIIMMKQISRHASGQRAPGIYDRPLEIHSSWANKNMLTCSAVQQLERWNSVHSLTLHDPYAQTGASTVQGRHHSDHRWSRRTQVACTGRRFWFADSYVKHNWQQQFCIHSLDGAATDWVRFPISDIVYLKLSSDTFCYIITWIKRLIQIISPSSHQCYSILSTELETGGNWKPFLQHLQQCLCLGKDDEGIIS